MLFVKGLGRTVALAAAMLIAVAGCDGGKPSGTVAGTVKYNGSPLQSGNVNLISVSGDAAMAKIAENGTFKVDGPLPTGEYRVYLSAPIPEPLPPGQKQPKLPKFNVPPKFTDMASAKMTVTVKSGANDVPLDFKD